MLPTLRRRRNPESPPNRMVRKKSSRIIVGVLLAVLLAGAVAVSFFILKIRGEKNLIEKRLEQERSRLNRQVEDLRREKDYLLQEEAKLEKRIEFLKKSVSEKIESESILKKEVENLSKDRKQLARAFAETKGSLERLRLSAEEKQTLLESKKKENIKARKKLSVKEALLRVKLESLRQEREDQNQIIAELIRQLNIAREDLNQLQPKPNYLGPEENEKPSNKAVLFQRHFNQGLAYDKKQEYEKSIKEYKKALELYPENPDAHYNIAVVYDDHIGDKEKAVFHYKKYLMLNPDSPDRHKVEVWIFQAKKNLDWQKQRR